MKCPTLPVFKDEIAWQTVWISETRRLLLDSKILQHFNAVHAITDTKEKVATPKQVEQPSQSFRGGPEVRNQYMGCEERSLTYDLRFGMWQRNRLYPAWPT